MKNKFVRFTTVLTVVMLLVLSLQYLFSSPYPGLYIESSLFEGHILNFVLTVSSFGVLCIFTKMKSSFVGFAFMGFSVLKMILTILFLLPMFKNESLKSIDYVLQFFSIYFFYLILELWFTFRLLIKK